MLLVVSSSSSSNVCMHARRQAGRQWHRACCCLVNAARTHSMHTRTCARCRIYYFPAQDGMGICSSLGDSPMTMCTDTVSELLTLQDAMNSGSESAYINAINAVIRSGRAVVSNPMPFDTAWNERRGCSAVPPV